MWEQLLTFVREQPSYAAAKPAIRHRLVEVGIEIGVAQFLSYRVASLQQAGKIPNYEATIAKLYSSELGQRLSRSGIELLGMYGQLHPKSKYAQMKGRMERYYQLSVAETIAGGTSEVMRGVAAIRGLGLSRG
jgi:alkylation response protein AidB-like acyl-CoA dehydrogenase